MWVVDPISGDKADLKSINDAEKSCMHMIAYVYIYIYIYLVFWFGTMDFYDFPYIGNNNPS